MIERSHDEVSVVELCRALDVSESGYYAWRETKTSTHDQRDTYLSKQIQTVFEDSRHTCGSNRVEAALRAQGILYVAQASHPLDASSCICARAGESASPLLNAVGAESLCRGKPASTGLQR